MLMIIKAAQETAAEAVQALPPMLNATADKIDAYVAATPSIAGNQLSRVIAPGSRVEKEPQKKAA